MTFIADKDPDEVIDYCIDWTSVLNAQSPVDTISTSTWTAENGLVIDSNTNTTTEATVWVSGGNVNKITSLTNKIVTAGGRTHERSIELRVRQK